LEVFSIILRRISPLFVGKGNVPFLVRYIEASKDIDDSEVQAKGAIAEQLMKVFHFFIFSFFHFFLSVLWGYGKREGGGEFPLTKRN